MTGKRGKKPLEPEFYAATSEEKIRTWQEQLKSKNITNQEKATLRNRISA
jgi:hypothetical protein